MLFPCEVSLKYFLPAVRANVVEKLYEKKYTQKEIAMLLGISQAAVSKYLSKKYNTKIKKLKERKEVKSAADEFVEKLLKNKDTQIDFKSFCKICMEEKLYKKFSDSPKR